VLTLTIAVGSQYYYQHQSFRAVKASAAG
jgi:hypothetical protein